MKIFSVFLKFLSLLIILVVITGVLVSSQVLAQSSNKTNLIRIDVKEDTQNQKINLTYKILEQFNQPSRGVFFSLPKNQNGVLTDYRLLRVQRSVEPFAQIPDPTNPLIVAGNFSTNTYLQPEPYRQFLELDQFRLRVGDENTFIDTGIYYYEIEVEASYNLNVNYEFTILRDWLEDVDTFQVYFNNTDICRVQIDCNGSKINLSLNPEKPALQNSFAWLYFLIPYAILTVLGLLLTWFSWKVFAKDPHPIVDANQPVFEPPTELLPWEASFLLKDSNLQIKETLLSYILWLNNKKIISLKLKDTTSDAATNKKIILG